MLYSENDIDLGLEGTLLSVIDRCVTPFGRRLLRQWVAEPLRRITDLESRLDAVDALIQNSAFAGTLTGLEEDGC